ATDAVMREIHSLITGDCVVIFVPGMTRTRAGQEITVPTPVLKFLAETGAPLLPLYVDHPDDTALSTEVLTELDRVVFSFGRVLPRESGTLANLYESLLVAGEVAFTSRPILKSHLAFELLKGLKKHGQTNYLIDGNDESELKFDKLMAAAIVLSKLIKRRTSKKRVAIVLPPGKGGLLANVAVLFAGKVPVNLNFTAGESAVQSCIKQADIDKFITGSAFIEKMPSFPWPEDDAMIKLEKVLPKLKLKIGAWLGFSKLVSANALASLVGIPKQGGEEEAVLLFTSGSSGNPKGVVLSHKNLLANVNQFGCRIDLKSHESALGCLPLFHSFGCTVTMWYPIIEGFNLVTYPSPLDTVKLAELIEKFKVSLVVATPTFLRGYLRRAKKEQFESVRLVVTGAEKLPKKVAESFLKKFDVPVLEGYGLTETSPVTNVNLPDEYSPSSTGPALPNGRLGSVGLFIPGMAVRITDPETFEPLPLHESGMIWLKGPNVFSGYLNEPEKTAEVIINGWFKTGDIGRVDEEGFLYIEGRLSRFSKIGGEMVPHETVESAINQALELTDDERRIAVMGVPDEAKGEALVLLVKAGLDVSEMRQKLLDNGIPALWVPKRVVEIDEIPMLASGKLDLKGCEVAAAQN
ncbi:MAG: AMP-binding protein, partial [Verrucomicrobiota bacterium]